MKLTQRVIITTLIAAIALPASTFAAKADKRKKDDVLPALASVDKDKDEAVSEAEFVAANEKFGADAAKRRFGALDKNSDGKLSKEEYAAGATPEKRKRTRKMDDAAIPAFASVDKDKDEFLSETEFVAAHEKLGANAASLRFGSLDKNSDGKLSKEEYAAGATPEKRKRKKNQE